MVDGLQLSGIVALVGARSLLASNMSVQEYASDALAPQYDSTGILVNRLHNWKYTIEYFINYFQGYLAFQKQATSSIEKLRKGLTEPPQFLANRTDLHGTKDKKSSKDQKELAGPAPAPGTFGSAFVTLQRKTDILGQQSESAANQIKNDIIPHLQSALKDIEQQYKTLKSSNTKLSKFIEKSRGETERLVEKLGKYCATHGHMDPSDDPFVLKRRIKSSIAEQVQGENESAEQGLALQNNFLSFEEHLISVIQQSMRNMQHVVETFGTAQISTQVDISDAFGSIDKAGEWSEFLTHNKGHLVPQNGYQRAVDNISFQNEEAAATKPVIAGYLTRTTTVLKKLQTNFYAVTAAGYLQEFKSEDPTSDPSPTLSLYLPHSVLGTLPPPSCTDFTFKIDAKNSNKKFGRGHSYQFRASSYDELGEWYYAIARKCLPEHQDSPGAGVDSNPDSRVGSPAPGTTDTAAGGATAASADLDVNDQFASFNKSSSPPVNNPHAGPITNTVVPDSPTTHHIASDGLGSPQSPALGESTHLK